ncbi:EAL domain-containing protein [Magnetococcales bacterium HHB-1]
MRLGLTWKIIALFLLLTLMAATTIIAVLDYQNRHAWQKYRRAEIQSLLVAGKDLLTTKSLLEKRDDSQIVRFFTQLFSILEQPGEPVYLYFRNQKGIFQVWDQTQGLHPLSDMEQRVLSADWRELSNLSVWKSNDHVKIFKARVWMPLSLQGEMNTLVLENAIQGKMATVFNQQVIILLLVVISTGLAGVFFLTRYLMAPLEKIRQAMESFETGAEDTIRLKIKKESEFGAIFHAFTRLKQRVKENTRELEKQRNYTTAIMDTAVDAIIIINKAGYIDSINPAAEKLFGYAHGELLGQKVNCLMPTYHATRHDRYIQDYCKTHHKNIVGTQREVQGVRKNGQRVPLELSVSEFSVDNSIFFTGILHDITERKEAELALAKAKESLEDRVMKRTQDLKRTNEILQKEIVERKRTEEQLQLMGKVFDNTGEGIIITDSETRIINVNPAFCRITGYSKTEALGETPSLTRSDRHDERFYQAMWAQLERTGQWSGEIWDRRKSGSVFPKKLTINAIYDRDKKVVNYVGIFSDISQLKMAADRLEKLAYYDPLTKLPNRILFLDRLDQECRAAARQKNKLAIFFIDLDRFKYVNDTLGHAFGDELLIQVSERLQECVRESDTVARLGGDEFTVILRAVQEQSHIIRVAQEILLKLAEPFILQDQEIFIGASIGISIYPDNGLDHAALTKNADVAMFRAKESGRNTYRFFTEEMNQESLRRLELEALLRRALEHEEFTLYYQPKISAQTGEIVGMEALVRWIHPDGKIISPAEFIPVAEETGLISPLGEWILEQACKQTKQWVNKGYSQLSVAVNLSAVQFKRKNLHETIEQALSDQGLAPQHLEVEITESMVVEDVDNAIETLRRFNSMGLKVSIDDFGTGYSSLSYLKRFPIHALKVDRSFIRDLTTDSDDEAIVRAILSMASDLGLSVVVEGVENVAQLAFLRDVSCQQMQGYFFSPPLSVEAFTLFLEEHYKNPFPLQQLVDQHHNETD